MVFKSALWEGNRFIEETKSRAECGHVCRLVSAHTFSRVRVVVRVRARGRVQMPLESGGGQGRRDRGRGVL
jgi:hypothetical protein